MDDLRCRCVLNLEQLSELLEKNRAAAGARVKEFSIGGKPFNFNSAPAIMGVVNLSADSWYRESVCLTAESAVHRGRTLHEQGAAIVDIGAESTLANAARADEAAQNSKLLPVIEALRAADILVSVETYNPAVTRACFDAGANVLNLTGADTVIHFDPWWNPAVEDQATDRAHRIGQSKVVTSYKLIARDNSR